MSRPPTEHEIRVRPRQSPTPREASHFQHMRLQVKPFTAVAVYPAPDDALHAKYARTGAYIDCFITEVSAHVSHAQFVEAFYTSRVFKLERLILKWLVDKPSTDAEAMELAAGCAIASPPGRWKIVPSISCSCATTWVRPVPG